jgi:hypothetical protein
MTDPKVASLRRIVLVLVFVIIFGAVAAPIGVIVAVQEVQQNTQTEITCTTLEANLIVAKAVTANRVLLVRIAHNLGLHVELPPRIDLPEVPPECAE